MSIGIENRFAAIEKLVAAAQAKGLDGEVVAYHCKLGCIMVCGAIERSVEILVTERLGGRSAPQVTSFLRSYFKRGTNYDCDEILQLLFKFDSEWGSKFKSFIEDKSFVKESVSSCYAIRNSIAHGGGQSLGPAALKQYLDHSLTMIAHLEELLRK